MCTLKHFMYLESVDDGRRNQKGLIEMQSFSRVCIFIMIITFIIISSTMTV